MKKQKLSKQQKKSFIALKRFCKEFHVGIYVDYLNAREDLYLRQWLYRHFKRLKMLDLFSNYNLIEFRQFKKSVLPPEAAYEQAQCFLDSVEASLNAYDYILQRQEEKPIG